jgi:hypothetical protein
LLSPLPVLADATNNSVFFASTGEFTGMVSGVLEKERRDESRQEEAYDRLALTHLRRSSI